jgi:hypothetical protein
MASDSLSAMNMIFATIFIVSTAAFCYYLYMVIKGYVKCTSDKLPCPNTCNPGYECKQKDVVPDFVIGDVVQNGVAEDEAPELEEEAPEDEGVEEIVEVDEEVEVPPAPAIELVETPAAI